MLNEYRRAPERWMELAWDHDAKAEEYCDKNAERRHKVIIALQFDGRATDEDFLRFLLAEEIKDRSNDTFQGVTTSLKRAASVLAKYRNPANLGLMAQAKAANFDTHCGFDWHHLLSAGVEKTFGYLSKASKDDQDLFHSYFESKENCELTEKDIEHWLQIQEGEFPSKLDNLDDEDKIDLAFDLEEKALAKELVDAFEHKMTDSKEQLSTLKYYRAQLRDYESEIAIAEKLLDYKKDKWSKAAEQVHIAELHLKLRQLDQSWASIKRAIEISKSLHKGELAHIADVCIKIINHTKAEHGFMAECYRFGISHLGYFQSLNQAKEKLQAAIRMNDDSSIKRFEKLVRIEQAKLDELKRRLG